VQGPTPDNPPSHGDGQGLRHNYLSTLENVAQSIGTMGPVATIGTVLPLLIYKSGNGTWLLFLVILGVFCLISANINVFASRFASAGSLAAFAEAGLGKWAGSLTGWSYVVAMMFVVTSSGVSSAYYLAMVISHFTHHPPGQMGLIAITLLVVLMAWWPSHHDIKLSTKVMLAAELTSILGIVVILGAAMVGSHRWVDRSQLHLEGVGFHQFQLGFVLIFMTLAGFESTTTLGEEAKKATRTLPRVMFLCILPTGAFFVAGIYCLTSLSHGQNLALDQADAPLDLIAQSVGLPTLGWLSTLGVAISCFGCALGGFNAGSRVIYSMARSRHLWRYFEAVHPVNGTPHRALAMLAGVAVVLPCVMLGMGVTMSETMDYLMQIASFGFIGGYLAVCVAAPVYLATHFKLGPVAVAVALGAVSAIGAVLFMSVIPAPDPPYRYFPFVFAGLLVAGMFVTACVQPARPRGTAPAAPAAKTAG
jgi:amino acid transporter